MDWSGSGPSGPSRSKPISYSESAMLTWWFLTTGIESYIKEAYPWSKTTYIAGTDISDLNSQDNKARNSIASGRHRRRTIMILGRFVPENNYETAIREFMAPLPQSRIWWSFVTRGNPYFEELRASDWLGQPQSVVEMFLWIKTRQ